MASRSKEELDRARQDVRSQIRPNPDLRSIEIEHDRQTSTTDITLLYVGIPDSSIEEVVDGIKLLLDRAVGSAKRRLSVLDESEHGE